MHAGRFALKIRELKLCFAGGFRVNETMAA